MFPDFESPLLLFKSLNFFHQTSNPVFQVQSDPGSNLHSGSNHPEQRFPTPRLASERPRSSTLPKTGKKCSNRWAQAGAFVKMKLKFYEILEGPPPPPPWLNLCSTGLIWHQCLRLKAGAVVCHEKEHNRKAWECVTDCWKSKVYFRVDVIFIGVILFEIHSRQLIPTSRFLLVIRLFSNR